jgi:hypothetical protein
MKSAAVACLPTAASLLLLLALFMQISGVSLTLTWPPGFVYSEFSCAASDTSFPLSKHTGRGDTAPAFSGWCVCLQLMWEVGFSPSPVEFSSLHHSHKLSCSWLLGACPRSCRSLSSPAPPVYLQFQEGFPSPPLLHSVLLTLFAMCLYCSYCLLLSFSFFPGWTSFCPRGYADLAQACLWEYHGTAKLTLSESSQAVWAWATGSLGALLVSPFNVKWRFSAMAGCVEGSKFCLFLVVLPARCVSSISPRFHCRRHAFCFLPLATIFGS